MVETLSVTQLQEEGKAAYQRCDYKEAAKRFKEAAEVYRSNKDESNAAEMLNNLSVALLQAGDAKGAFQAVDGTESFFATSGDIRRQAIALGNRGAALEGQKRYKEAIEAYSDAADLFEQIGESELLAPVMQSLARLQLRNGKAFQGLASIQAGLGEMKRPALHQRVLKKLVNTFLRLFLRS